MQIKPIIFIITIMCFSGCGKDSDSHSFSSPPEESKVSLLVFDLLGREVKTLINGNLKPGFHKVIWNGTDHFEKQVATGMYFTVMQSGDFRDVRKMVLLK